MGTLFIDDYEYKLQYICLMNDKKIVHFSVTESNNNFIQNVNINKPYMAVVHFNGQIFDLGEIIESKRNRKGNMMYYIGDSREQCVTIKYEKKCRIMYPLFVSLPVSQLSLPKRSK